MSTLTADERKAFIDAMSQDSTNIDLFFIAEACQLDYFEQVLPEIKNNKKFKADLDRHFEMVKVKITQSIYREAIHGSKGGAKVSLPAARFIVDMINSGAIYGANKDAEKIDNEKERKKKQSALNKSRKALGLQPKE